MLLQINEKIKMNFNKNYEKNYVSYWVAGDSFLKNGFQYAKSTWRKYINRKTLDVDAKCVEVLDYIYTKK